LAILKSISLFGLGVLAGGMIAIQSVLNAALGQRTGNLGSVLILTLVSIATLAVLILQFPGTADFRSLPGLSQWYLYAGGVLGVAILAAPIFLVPRIGATTTLVAFVMGQLLAALAIDHFGLFAAPTIKATLVRLIGVALVASGALLVAR